jgi:hypothetical protein
MKGIECLSWNSLSYQLPDQILEDFNHVSIWSIKEFAFWSAYFSSMYFLKAIFVFESDHSIAERQIIGHRFCWIIKPYIGRYGGA